MYGCEAWTTSKQIQNKLEATEMWFLRRMLRIPWTAKKTNERVLNEANKRISLVRTMRKRHATFLGHVMRRGKLEHLENLEQVVKKNEEEEQRQYEEELEDNKEKQDKDVFSSSSPDVGYSPLRLIGRFSSSSDWGDFPLY
ncbi:RNA-directed DNA polymerase from mobile element jockey [Plakobranchus ocellatus]|uniref:RNA-directed DNA polymerase from mobile element jockey n=1 Tax=Plakobranchus ocellatus TaxID=259542 RepID=A0AAV4D7H2_9GAST|nr:RNA-directed DNA polymerase from mobile element jockey [Plakobranchus ocellatus]